MPSLFGVELGDLTLSDVERFLRSAGDEGLTWEAKGTQLHADHIRVAASAFGNSILGGYLILGADRTKAPPGAPWEITGVDVGTELGVWIASVLRDVDSPPIYAIAGPWTLPNGRDLAVIQFRASPTPPVIAPSGLVYERLVGMSPKVTDRASLARLFERGERARAEAERKANTRSDAAIRLSRFGDQTTKAGFAVAVAATGGTTDRSALLFSDSFTGRLLELLRRLGRREGTMRRPDAQMWQDRVEGWTADGDQFAACITWDGAASVAFRLASGEPALEYVIADGLLRPMLESAAELAAAIGGYGPAYATFAGRQQRGGDVVFARRWIDLQDVTDDTLTSLDREFARATGRWAPEP